MGSSEYIYAAGQVVDAYVKLGYAKHNFSEEEYNRIKKSFDSISKTGCILTVLSIIVVAILIIALLFWNEDNKSIDGKIVDGQATYTYNGNTYYLSKDECDLPEYVYKYNTSIKVILDKNGNVKRVTTAHRDFDNSIFAFILIPSFTIVGMIIIGMTYNSKHKGKYWYTYSKDYNAGKYRN